MPRFLYILVPAVAATTVVLVSWFTTHAGGYSPPPEHRPALETLTLPTYAVSSAPPLTDNRSGTLVVDTLHFNNFLEGELEPLLSRVIDLGYDLDFFGDRMAVRFDFSESRRAATLERALRGASSLLVIAPIIEYGAQETEVVRRFVQKGGKVVLAGEPTRFQQSNSLASALGINFEKDYLYNVVEHETNYRNVIFRDFTSHQVTAGVSAVVLYTASSLTGAGEPLVRADADTHSSARESTVPLSPMLLAMDGRVVAIGDATFIKPPYNEVLDNDRLVRNLADFLTTSERRFDLEDFPFSLADQVDVVMAGPRVLEIATDMADLLSTGDRRAALTTLERPGVDTVFVGLFDDAGTVRHHLAASNVTLAEGRIVTPFTRDIAQEGNGLILLDTRGERRVLVVLGFSVYELSNLVQQLGTGQFRSGLVAPNLGLYERPLPSAISFQGGPLTPFG